MAKTIETSWVMDRPVEQVFHFMVIDHVRNHPRWDPDITLEKATDGPMGVGTVLKRVSTRSGSPVEGTMEVVEFTMNESMGMVIHDGQAVMNSRVTFEAVGDNETQISLWVEIPWMDEDADTEPLMKALARSQSNQRALMEAEL